jgi:hypothetical protein
MYLGVPTVRVTTHCKAYQTPLAVLEDSGPNVAQFDMKLFLCQLLESTGEMSFDGQYARVHCNKLTVLFV